VTSLRFASLFQYFRLVYFSILLLSLVYYVSGTIFCDPLSLTHTHTYTNTYTHTHIHTHTHTHNRWKLGLERQSETRLLGSRYPV
jgi:hypothetical protein